MGNTNYKQEVKDAEKKIAQLTSSKKSLIKFIDYYDNCDKTLSIPSLDESARNAKSLIKEIDTEVSNLSGVIRALNTLIEWSEDTTPKTLSEQIKAAKEPIWVIDTTTPTPVYYKAKYNPVSAFYPYNLTRKNIDNNLNFNSVNNFFRLATPDEVEQHEEFLAFSAKNPSLSEIVQAAKTYVWIVYKTNSKGRPRLLQVTFDKHRPYPFIIDGRTSVAIKGFDLNQNYRLATTNEIEQHEAFLIEQAKPKVEIKRYPNVQPIDKCAFYMVTCRGIHGSTVRHTTYESAEKEATRVALKENHDAFVVGVVATIKVKK